MSVYEPRRVEFWLWHDPFDGFWHCRVPSLGGIEAVRLDREKAISSAIHLMATTINRHKNSKIPEEKQIPWIESFGSAPHYAEVIKYWVK